MRNSKRMIIGLILAGVALIGGLAFFATHHTRNAIHITTKSVTDDKTNATLANFIQSDDHALATDVQVNIANFNPQQVSAIKTLYIKTRLQKGAKQYLATHDFTNQQRIFLFNALQSEVKHEDLLSKTTYGPLSGIDVYMVHQLQAKKILKPDFKYTAIQDGTLLQRVLAGNLIPKPQALKAIEAYDIIDKLNGATTNVRGLNDLLANILSLKGAHLSDAQLRRLEQVWEQYQQPAVSSRALMLPDAAFIVLAEFERNLSHILHQSSFFDFKHKNMQGEIFQPAPYNLDNYRNVAFVLASQYYTQNKLSASQVSALMLTLPDTPRSAEEAYYLNVINKILKTKLAQPDAIPTMTRHMIYNQAKFYDYLADDSQPEQTVDTSLLGQLQYYGLQDVSKAGKKFVANIDVDLILNSPANQHNQMINEYVLLLKKYDLLNPRIKKTLLTYLAQHENQLYGYTLENDRAFTIESCVYALQVKSILMGGRTIDIH